MDFSGVVVFYIFSVVMFVFLEFMWIFFSVRFVLLVMLDFGLLLVF